MIEEKMTIKGILELGIKGVTPLSSWLTDRERLRLNLIIIPAVMVRTMMRKRIG